MKKKTKRIHISLPEELLEAFDGICKKNYSTRSEAIKSILTAFVVNDKHGSANNSITILGTTYWRKK